MSASRLQVGILGVAAVIAIVAVAIQLRDALGEPRGAARGPRRAPKRATGPALGGTDPVLSVGAPANRRTINVHDRADAWYL